MKLNRPTIIGLSRMICVRFDIFFPFIPCLLIKGSWAIRRSSPDGFQHFVEILVWVALLYWNSCSLSLRSKSKIANGACVGGYVAALRNTACSLLKLHGIRIDDLWKSHCLLHVFILHLECYWEITTFSLGRSGPRTLDHIKPALFRSRS